MPQNFNGTVGNLGLIHQAAAGLQVIRHFIIRSLHKINRIKAALQITFYCFWICLSNAAVKFLNNWKLEA